MKRAYPGDVTIGERRVRGRPAMPSKKKIAEAWCGSRDLPFDLQGYSAAELAQICWACERQKDEISILKLRQLTRAHIQPVVLKGSFEPLNFFLLCHCCHTVQPDTAPREIQLQWLLNQPHYLNTFLQRIIRDMRDLASRGIAPSEVQALLAEEAPVFQEASVRSSNVWANFLWWITERVQARRVTAAKKECCIDLGESDALE